MSRLVEVFDRFASFAVTPAFTWWYCGGIVAAAVLIGLVFTFRAARAKRRIRAAAELLAPFTSAGDFAKGFERFHQRLGENELFLHPWQEFRETLVMPEDDGPVENTVPASAFFNDESLLEGLNVRFYNTVPSFLTGAGILGTFLGLVAGLWVAREGLAANEVDEMRKALGGLLAGGSLAFWTSIVGLLTSIAFSWWEKDRLHRLHGRIGDFCRRLDGFLDRLTPEALAKRSLRQAEKQTAMLERFNTELALQIASALEERMAQRLSPQLEKLVIAIEGMRSDRGDSLKESLDQMVTGMVTRFEAAFQGAAGGEMRGLATTIQGVSAELKNAVSSLSGGQGELVSGLTDFQRRLDELLTGLASKLEAERETSDAVLRRQLAEIGERVAQVNQGLTDAAATVGNSSRAAVSDIESTIKGSVRALVETTDRMKAVVERLPMILEELHGIAQQLTPLRGALESSTRSFGESAGDVRAASRALVEAKGSVDSAAQGMASLMGSIQSERQSLERTFAAHHDRFAEVDEHAQRLFQQIVDGLDNYTEKVREFSKDLEDHLSRATGSLAGAVGELSEAIEDLKVPR